MSNTRDGFGPDGIHENDRAWLAEQLKKPGPLDDGDGVCFATWNDEVLGPFACKADAHAAHQEKLDELEAQGVDSANIRMAVVFADPIVYHVPPKETING